MAALLKQSLRICLNFQPMAGGVGLKIRGRSLRIPKVIVGIVASGHSNPSRKGDIRALIYDLDLGTLESIELHDQLQLDDHDSPVFLQLPNGSMLTLYAKHGDENLFYYRLSKPGNFSRWESEQHFVPSDSSRITYSNLFLLPEEDNRIYNFFRGLDNSFKPSYVFSTNMGQSWNKGNIVINVPSEFRHRPYVRYASNRIDSIHLVYTEGHPRNYDNSIYHVVYRKGFLHTSDGIQLAPLTVGLKKPELGTLVFRGSPDRVAWTIDIELDSQGLPFTVFSVQENSAGLPPREGGLDIRYHFARWTGQVWEESEIAFAGRRLYPREDDYSGLVALYPGRPEVLYISTDADPATGEPLVSRTDGQRHYEIFQGEKRKGHEVWKWTPLTSNSTVDNLRPIIPSPVNGRTALLWLRGEYRTYTDYSQSVAGIILED